MESDDIHELLLRIWPHLPPSGMARESMGAGERLAMRDLSRLFAGGATGLYAERCDEGVPSD